MIGVLHLGLGNVGSLCQCLDRLGYEYKTLASPDFSNCEKLIFPGVGHYGRASEILDKGWREPILDWIHQDKTFIGICLGFQLLFSGSVEAPSAKGLGVFEADCAVVPSQKIPHMGWNRIQNQGELLKNYASQWMYFVHSYAPPVTEDTVLTTEDGLASFSVAVLRDNVGGLQFHPEKSSQDGQAILKAFIEKDFSLKEELSC